MHCKSGKALGYVSFQASGAILMEPSTGFEPAPSAWKTEVLPLHHDGIYLFRGMLRGFGFSRFPEPFVHAQGWYKNSQNSFLPWLSLLGYASRPISRILSRSCIFLSFELGLEHCHLVCAFDLPLVYIVIHSLHFTRLLEQNGKFKRKDIYRRICDKKFMDSKPN